MAATIGVAAQENNIKLNLTGTNFGNYALGYERVITPKSTLNLNAGYWNMNHGLFSIDNFFTKQVDFFDTGNGLTFDGFNQGFHTALEYRFYPQMAMNGVYLSPYLRYWQHGFNLLDEIRDTDFNINTRLSGLGLGFQVGYQWTIADVFTIDWYFIGIGVERYVLKGDYTTSNNSNFNYSTIEPDVKKAFESDYEFITGKVKTKATDDHMRVTLPVFGPGFKSGLSIGYRF